MSTKVTLPFMTGIAAVTGTHTDDWGEHKTYDSVRTGFWIENHDRYGWPILKFNLPDGKTAQITLIDSDVKRFIKELAGAL